MLERVESAIATFDAQPAEARALLESLALAIDEAIAGRGGAAGHEAYALMQAATQLWETTPDDDVELRAFWRETASRAAELTGNPEDPAWLAWRLALGAEQAGRFGEAERILDAACRQPAAIPASLPWLLIERSVVARYRGSWAAAMAELERAELALQALPAADPYTSVARAIAAGERAQVYVDLGLPELAEEWLAREAELARENGSYELGVASTIHRLDQLLALRDDATAAETATHALEADASGTAVLRPRHRAMLLIRRGAALRETRPDAARTALERALGEPTLQEWERHSAELVLAELGLDRGALDEAGERLASARRRFATWVERDELRHPGTHAQLAALEARLALAAQAPRETLVARLDELRRGYDALLDEWRSIPPRQSGVGFLRFHVRRMVLGDLLRLTLAVDPGAAGLARALADIAEAHALGSLSRAVQAAGPDVASIRRHLVPEGGALLLYLLAPRASHVFWIDEHAIEHAELKGDERLSELRLDWLARAMQPQGDPLASGIRLRDELLPAPIAARLRGVEAVSLCGADAFGPLAFEALPSFPGQERSTLGQVHAVDHVPSLALGVHLARHSPSATPRRIGVLVADDPAPSTRGRFQAIVDLPWSEEDTRTLVDAYQPGSWSRTGSAALSSALRGAALEGLGVLHLVAHGVFDGARERPAGLALAASPRESEILWCADVEALHAPPLVVLASCGSARGPLRPGEDGVQHLGGAFLRAGASTVVLASNDLGLEASKTLFAHFHRALSRGLSPAYALREARRSTAAQPAWAHPAYHGFVWAFGAGQRPVFPPQALGAAAPAAAASRLAAVLGALAALALAALVLRSSRSKRRRTPHDMQANQPST